MQRGVLLPAVMHPPDERLQGTLLFDGTVRPPVEEAEFSSFVEAGAEEILPSVVDQREAFHVEEDVYLGRRRQERQSARSVGLIRSQEFVFGNGETAGSYLE